MSSRLRVSQRPEKLNGRFPSRRGPAASTVATKAPSRSMSTRTSSKPSQSLVSGNHALYTASLMQNNSRSQGTSGSASAKRCSWLCSSGNETSGSTPSGRDSAGSASTPIVRTALPCATAAARNPGQCVMLPTTPVGHSGAPLPPRGIATGGIPRSPRARRARTRTVANSLRRASPQRASCASSSANSRGRTGLSAKASADRTAGGRISSITHVGCGPGPPDALPGTGPPGSQLLGRVAAPSGVRCQRLALHEKGVGLQQRALAHRHAVVDERADAERAPGPDHSVIGLEDAVFHRVALDNRSGVERAVVADGHQRALRNGAAVVEDPSAQPDADEAPDPVSY